MAMAGEHYLVDAILLQLEIADESTLLLVTSKGNFHYNAPQILSLRHPPLRGTIKTIFGKSPLYSSGEDVDSHLYEMETTKGRVEVCIALFNPEKQDWKPALIFLGETKSWGK